jgi:hypothetical protein
MSKYLKNETTLDKLFTIQTKIESLASKSDSELSELLSGVSASCELAIELVSSRISADKEHHQRLSGSLAAVKSYSVFEYTLNKEGKHLIHSRYLNTLEGLSFSSLTDWVEIFSSDGGADCFNPQNDIKTILA